MANTNRPFGFIPVGHLDGSPFNGRLTPYLFNASNAVYLGDPVIHGGTAGAAGTSVNGVNTEGMPTADRAAASSTNIIGVVVSFSPLQSNLTQLHKSADSTARIGYVAGGPDVIFEVQADNGTAALAAADVGENADMITWAAGNTTTGISAMELDSSTHVTSTAQWRILRFVPRPDNAIGDYAKVWVVANEHEFKTTTGT